MREEASKDLASDIRNKLTGVRAVDSEIAALHALNRLQASDTERLDRGQTLVANQTIAEQKLYESTWVLERNGAGPKAP